MSSETGTCEQPQLVFNRGDNSTPAEPIGGVTMYAYLSFNEGIGPDRSHGSVSGHVSLKQGGVENPGVGDFVVSGTFAVTKPADIVKYVAITLNSVRNPLIGRQTFHGMITLKGNW